MTKISAISTTETDIDNVAYLEGERGDGTSVKIPLSVARFYSEGFDFPTASGGFATSSSGQASKAIVIVPLLDIDLTEVIPYFPSKTIGADYVVTVASLVGATYTIDTVLATSSTYTAADTAAEWRRFVITPVSLTAGMRYCVIVSRTDGTGTTALTIGTTNTAQLVSYAASALTQTAYATYTAVTPPVAGTTAASSGTNGGFRMAFRVAAN